MNHLDYALNKARELPVIKGRFRHYAVVVNRRGRILGEASNSYTKTSPKMMFAAMKVGLPWKQFWHAECLAIHKVKNIDKAYKIIIARVGANGLAMSSKPCKICERRILEVGLKSVEYSIGE